MHTKHKLRAMTLGAALLTYGTGCYGSEEDLRAEFSRDLERTGLETLDELAARTAIPGEEDRYLVESDMALSFEDLEAYYDKRSSVDKAIVTTVRNTSTGAIFDAVRANAMSLRYCLTGGWGGSEAAEADVEATLLSAARAWEGVAKIRFTHVSSSDGAGCTQAIVGTQVDFVVKPNVGSANTSYAWWAFAQVQELAVGGSLGRNVSVMTHELGHVLGLDHEQFHDDSGLGCAAPGYTPPGGNLAWDDQRELTSYDNESVMHYFSGGVASCGGGSKGDMLSVLDGVGIRSLYGNPDWWATVI